MSSPSTSLDRAARINSVETSQVRWCGPCTGLRPMALTVPRHGCQISFDKLGAAARMTVTHHENQWRYIEGNAMRLIVADDYEGMSRLAADIVTDAVRERPNSAVLVATGNTPMGLYTELAARQSRKEADFSGVRAVQLDEYLGLGADDRRSLYGWMRRSFVEPLGIPDEQVMRLAGDAADPEAVCMAFGEAIRDAGGIDISILGLGPNGHLGFNEPPAEADAPTRVIALTPESIASNASYWGDTDDVPRQAMTVGMDCILGAKLTILVVSGEHKRDILRQTLQGQVSSNLPASWLRMAENVVVVADRAAAGDVELDVRSGTSSGMEVG